MFGYAGNILFINLTQKKVKRQKLGSRCAHSFIG